MVRDSGSSRRKKMGPQSHHRVLAPRRRGAVVGPDDRGALRTRARDTPEISEMRWRICGVGKPDIECADEQTLRSVDRGKTAPPLAAGRENGNHHGDAQ